MNNDHPSQARKQLIELDPDRRANVNLLGQAPPQPAPAAAIAAALPAAPLPPRKQAVLVAHGMGQQLPFETLTGVAEAIRKGAESANTAQTSLNVGFAIVSGERIPRVELSIQPKGQPAREVHLYEAYWAPLTEGKVTTRDAFWFLLSSTWTGILRSWAQNRFRRWMFYQWQPFAVHPVLLMAAFLSSAGVLLSLALINSVIVAVAASTSLTSAWKGWPSPALRSDLTVDLALTEAVLMGLLLLGVGVPIALRKLKGKEKLKQVPTAYLFLARGFVYVAVLIVVAAGASVFYHLLWHRAPGTASWWQLPPAVFAPNAMTRLLIGLATLSVLWAWIRRTWKDENTLAVLPDRPGLGNRLSKWQLRPGYRRLAKTLVAILCPAAALLILWTLFYSRLGGSDLWPLQAVSRFVEWLARWLDRPGIHNAVIWASAVGASLFVSSFVRQYVGDVAAYISAHKVSTFAEIRQRIQEATLKVFRAVYQQRDPATNHPEYTQVVVVGHSLGSVIAYDALNSLLVDDQLGGNPHRVAERTRALVTFGSPMDKTAYVFRSQMGNGLEVREALAAARQPMICSYDFRPKEWVNIYSPEDWISGSLEYYDDDRPIAAPPELKNGGRQRIRNLRDPEACVPLVAHTQYWGNQLLAKTLFQALTKDQID